MASALARGGTVQEKNIYPDFLRGRDVNLYKYHSKRNYAYIPNVINSCLHIQLTRPHYPLHQLVLILEAQMGENIYFVLPLYS